MNMKRAYLVMAVVSLVLFIPSVSSAKQGMVAITPRHAEMQREFAGVVGTVNAESLTVTPDRHAAAVLRGTTSGTPAPSVSITAKTRFIGNPHVQSLAELTPGMRISVLGSMQKNRGFVATTVIIRK